MLSDLEAPTGVGADTRDAVVETLDRSGILREVGGRRGERIWVVADVIDELNDLESRIHAALSTGGSADPR
ncbi:hypothetical protein [Mycetocola saprophilus]|uniref:hypothetical protein n=1 Tax=Mycetocola saprophilus TaxID=76636 RepID=UPI003BEF4D62